MAKRHLSIFSTKKKTKKKHREAKVYVYIQSIKWNKVGRKTATQKNESNQVKCLELLLSVRE